MGQTTWSNAKKCKRNLLRLPKAGTLCIDWPKPKLFILWQTLRPPFGPMDMPPRKLLKLVHILLLQIDGFLRGWILIINPLKVPCQPKLTQIFKKDTLQDFTRRSLVLRHLLFKGQKRGRWQNIKSQS